MAIQIWGDIQSMIPKNLDLVLFNTLPVRHILILKTISFHIILVLPTVYIIDLEEEFDLVIRSLASKLVHGVKKLLK